MITDGKTSDGLPILSQTDGSAWGPWCAILAVAVFGNLLTAASPIFWGGFSEYLYFSDAMIGEIMSAEYFGATLATIAGLFFVHRAAIDLRKVTYIALAAYAAGNLLTPSVLADPSLLKALRFCCGFSSGITYVVSATVIPGQKYANRLVPIFYGSAYITGFVFQPILPSIFANWGFDNSFRLMGAMAAAALVTYWFFPRRAADVATGVNGANAGASRSLTALFLIVLALLLQYIANSGLWLYFERIGVVSGHSAQTAASVVGLGTGVALIGVALATALTTRLRPFSGIVLGTALMAIGIVLLHFSKSLVVYAGAISLINVMTTFVTPFYFILLARIYHPAKAVVWGNIAVMVGFTLGPLLLGYTVREDSFALAINATLGLLAVSAALVGLYALGRKVSQPSMSGGI